ncbi:hypothetical protein ANO14919_124540 [Xylariales sp. No.14919]|nr:hypothetical protein ANO14919_124540 [Xylariales sp. No.14919]
MAVSPSAQSYQAVRRHLRPRYDSIWVPDSLLASAFERYAATFRTGVRYGSSVPGPMEHRKRLAKRHMGELHFGQPRSAAPIWELANLVDLTQWKWTPPTSSEARSRQNVNPSETRTLSDAVLNPLRLFFPTRTDATDSLHKLDKLLLPEDVVLSAVAERSISLNADNAPQYIINTALELSSRDISRGTGDTPLFSGFCESWRIALAGKTFHGEAISKVLTGITDGLMSIESVDAYSFRAIDRLKLLLVEATIEGISKGRTDPNTPFDHVAWSSILHEVSTIRMNTIRVFTRAMACVPLPSIKAVSSEILENLDTFFNALGQASMPPTLARQSAKMAVSLKSLGDLEFRFILDNATERVLKYTDVSGMNYPNIRYCWLLLLARLPGVDSGYLAQTCAILEAGLVTRPLTDSEICQLLLVWANSQAPLKQYARLRRVLRHNTSKFYRMLGVSLWKIRQFHRVKCFSKFLQAIGRETHVGLLAKGVSSNLRKEPCRLATIALGMRRPRAAIDILCLYEDSQRCKSSFWESRFGFRALEILTWVPNFDHKKLWRALKIVPDQRFKVRRQRGKVKRLQRNKITKIAAVGIVTGLSPYLTRRKGFSLMINCYHYLRKQNTNVPHSILRALVHNLTRPLIDGQPGVFSRLRYILYIIRRKIGQAAVQRLADMMEARRRFNFRRK